MGLQTWQTLHKNMQVQIVKLESDMNYIYTSYFSDGIHQ
jgi:hypothetical protein